MLITVLFETFKALEVPIMTADRPFKRFHGVIFFAEALRANISITSPNAITNIPRPNMPRTTIIETKIIVPHSFIML